MSRRVRVFTADDDWYAVRDSRGLWIVVDSSGRQPLLDPDPIARMYAVHLAAAAPGLRAGGAELVRRYVADRPVYGHDRRILAHLDGSISMSFPSTQTALKSGAFAPIPPERELPLDGAPEEVRPATRVLLRDRDLRLRSNRS